VIWIGVADDLGIGSFFWFGGDPGKPLPSINGYDPPRRATHNKKGERPTRKNHRLVPGNEFRPLATLDEVLETLFGRSLP